MPFNNISNCEFQTNKKTTFYLLQLGEFYFGDWISNLIWHSITRLDSSDCGNFMKNFLVCKFSGMSVVPYSEIMWLDQFPCIYGVHIFHPGVPSHIGYLQQSFNNSMLPLNIQWRKCFLVKSQWVPF